jgi:hypothetical protein
MTDFQQIVGGSRISANCISPQARHFCDNRLQAFRGQAAEPQNARLA